jgi:hypothetical protein
VPASFPGSPCSASIRTGVGTKGGHSPSAFNAERRAAARRERCARRLTPPESSTSTDQPAARSARRLSRRAIA